MPGPRWFGAFWCVGAMLIAASGSAEAAGTCGSGGPLGRHVNVPFQGSEYWVWAPSPAAGVALPVVLALHGDEGTPENSQYWFWDPVWAASPSFILVTPRAPNAGGSWYRAQASNEVWMDALLAQLASRYDVDVDRVYAVGVSGGSVFLGNYALKRQNVFAAVQWNCGGSGGAYTPPIRADCKTAGRFVISASDFLYGGTRAVYEAMVSRGNPAQWLEPTCQGHCCGPRSEYGAGAFEFFKTVRRCPASVPVSGCAAIGGAPGEVRPPPPAATDAGAGPADGGAGPPAATADAGASESPSGSESSSGPPGDSRAGGPSSSEAIGEVHSGCSAGGLSGPTLWVLWILALLRLAHLVRNALSARGGGALRS